MEVLNDGALGKKYHVAYCTTLENMQSKGRYDRYVATNDIDGVFLIDGKSKDSEEYIKGDTYLKVCKNCMTHLDYKGYKGKSWVDKNQLFDDFSLEEFFEKYQQFFKHKLKYKAGELRSTYVDNWREISINYRSSVNWICENCSVDLTQYTELLHTHHINGVKQDNSKSNLKALCCECHANEPDHGHMVISYKQKAQLRKILLNQTANSERV